MTEPVFSFTAPAGDGWSERIRGAFDLVRHRRHLEALNHSPVLEPLGETLDRAWVAVHRPDPGGLESFLLNEAALAVCRFAGVQPPPAERIAGVPPGPFNILCAGDLARVPGGQPFRKNTGR